MQLSKKGAFAPPPPLPEHAQHVSERLATWPGVLARTHWLLGNDEKVDGADFYLNERELGHLHLDGTAHVAVGRELSAALVKAGLAKPFRWSADFVVHAVQNSAQAEQALWLFELNRQRIEGVASDLLNAQIAKRTAARK